MHSITSVWCAAVLGLALLPSAATAQTAGAARVEVTLLDYNGSGTRHYTVVWVTTASGSFVKTLRKQGPSSWTSKEWRDHCQTWSTARGTSTALDGYTSATATTYAGTNSPVICEWDGHDAGDALMPDGPYKFWVQYAENSGQGPYTTAGLLWTKGPLGTTNTFANQGANFANMRVAWVPEQPTTIPPTITSAPPTPAATVGVPYTHTSTATGTTPITFSAAGLPPGLEISPDGVISGIPRTGGRFEGTLAAANGTLPDATQAFAIVVEVVAASLTATRPHPLEFVLAGTGPARGAYSVFGSSSLAAPFEQWTLAATGDFDDQGQFALTNALAGNLPGRFYLLRVP